MRTLTAILLALALAAPAAAHEHEGGSVLIFKGSRECARCLPRPVAAGPVVVVTPPVAEAPRRVLLPGRVVLVERASARRLPVSPARSFFVLPSRD